MNDISNAEKEWLDLLSENTRRTIERTKELERKGISVHLDGGEYYKDIDDWFKEELKRIKEKYKIQ